MLKTSSLPVALREEIDGPRNRKSIVRKNSAHKNLCTNNLKSYSTWTTALSINSCYTIIHTYFAKLCEEKKEEEEEDEDEEDEEEENKKEEEYKEEDEDEGRRGEVLTCHLDLRPPLQ